jgi:hypothetical protein
MFAQKLNITSTRRLEKEKNKQQWLDRMTGKTLGRDE